MWSSVERFSVQGLQFVMGLILARLLLPSDYGLIGMLAIFLAISQTFIDSGFGTALIQKKDRTETDFSTVFYFNISIAVLFYFVLFFSAPWIAKFYNAPLLTDLTKVIAFNIVISSFSIVQRARLTIQLDFKTQSKASLLSVFLGGLVGITMAYKGFGVWALVVQSLSRNFLNTLLLWFFAKWMPKIIFSKNSFKGLFSFGSKLLIAGLINTIFRNIYLIVIGKVYSASELGFYTRAKQFQRLPSENISGIINRVSFPVLSSVQNDNEKLLLIIKKLLRLAVFIVHPLMMGMIVLAEPMIRFILTEKWILAVPYLQLISVIGLFNPISVINLSILNVKGRSDLFLKLEIIKKALVVLNILITFPYGVKYMIIGQIAVSSINFLINTYYTGKLINYYTWTQIKDIFPIFAISLITVAGVYFITSIFDQDYLKLFIGLVSGVLLFFSLAHFGKFDEMYEMKQLFKGSIK